MSALSVAKGPNKQPNILLIPADDLGFDDLSLHRHPIVTKPNLNVRRLNLRSSMTLAFVLFVQLLGRLCSPLAIFIKPVCQACTAAEMIYIPKQPQWLWIKDSINSARSNDCRATKRPTSPISWQGDLIGRPWPPAFRSAD